MRLRPVAPLLLLALALTSVPALAAHIPIDYQDPVPGARYVSPDVVLLLRPGGSVDRATLAGDALLDVRGALSGAHAGRLDVADDGETVRFAPDRPFVPGETVSVRLGPGLRTARGAVAPLRYSFTISEGRGDFATTTRAVYEADFGPDVARALSDPAARAGARDPVRAARLDSLPSDFPALTRTVTGPGSPGRLFLSDISFGTPSLKSYLMIVDDDGHPLFYRRLEGFGFDFKMQADGRLTYFDQRAGRHYALDASLSVVDSFACGNGYATDPHDLQILPNGHALLLAYDPQRVDMSAIVPGGRPDANVVGLIVQEIDRDKRVVFQWRSWDHFAITDGTDRDYTAAVIDYVHGNAVAPDADGNLLLSSRHMDEITKISRRNGKILWRLGGKHNEFTFVDEPTPFSHQHDVRRLANGHLTLFDNGTLRDPVYSRVVEYDLDEARKSATRVWEYRPSPDIPAFAMGNAQRLANGNTIIGWGSASPTVTEVNPAGEKVTELALPQGYISYRAYRCPWPAVIEADVRLQSETIQAEGGGAWFRARLAVPDVSPEAIDAATLTLAGVAADAASDIEGSARPGDPIHVRFDRAALASALHPGRNEVVLEGRLRSGAALRGTAPLTLIDRAARASGPRLVGLPSGGAAPVALLLQGAPAGEYRASVFDVRGALVRRWSAPIEGDRPLLWSGKDRNGRRVSSGLYFVRVEGEGVRLETKVLLAH